MQKKLSERLKSIPTKFSPIGEFVKAYTKKEYHFDKAGTIQLVKNPDFEEAYFINIFAPATEVYFANFDKRHTFEIPEPILEFLRFANGFYFCDFNIYGLTPSMYESETGLLDRSIIQPLDLGTANDSWKKEYNQEGFHFGSRYYDDERNCGYFLTNGKINSYLINGEIVGTWSNFYDFLNDELTVTEKNEIGLNKSYEGKSAD